MSRSVLEAVFELVENEMYHQVKLRDEKKKFKWTCADIGIPEAEKLAVLNEETGEVAREVVEGLIKGEVDKEKLEDELIQVTAVTVSWILALRYGKTVWSKDR